MTKRRVRIGALEEVDPDHFVVDPRNEGYFKRFGHYWPKPEDHNVRPLHLMINRFRIRGAQIIWEYLVEGSLQIEGCDQDFKLPSFTIFTIPGRSYQSCTALTGGPSLIIKRKTRLEIKDRHAKVVPRDLEGKVCGHRGSPHVALDYGSIFKSCQEPQI